MICIVPLAGPDFFSPAYGVKPLLSIDGQTLIERAMKSRSWYRSGALRNENIIFILRDGDACETAEAQLADLFPACQFVTLGALTAGALLSALAGIALVKDFGQPLVVDLADLIYDAPPVPDFTETRDGFIPWFRSDDPAYSYLQFQSDKIVRTAEKEVISPYASAGTYFFRSASVFLAAVANCLENPDAYRVRNALFVCPVYNALIEKGARIEGFEVTNVVSYSKQFHTS
jgi:hypothetical protein